MKIKEIIKTYFNRNKKYIYSENVVHEMNGAVLHKSNIKIYEFHSDLIQDVTEYCSRNGFKNIDKIVFLSSYDTDIPSYSKNNIKMEGKSKISIIREDGKIIVLICICEYVNIKSVK